MAAIERVRRERDSGGGIDLNEMSSAVWQLVQLWDQLELQQERMRASEFHHALRELISGRA